MVPAGNGNNTSGALLFGQIRKSVPSAPDLECAYRLQHFRLAPNSLTIHF
jgi:hypothetical protein